jgi:hypothetical protein
VDETIRILISSGDTFGVKKEIKLTACYKYLLSILIEMKRSEQNIPRGALLTRILADVNVQPKHHLICVRMAINRNMDAQNFKLSAKLIKTLLPLGLQDAPKLQERLSVCEKNNFVDNSTFPYQCPSCKKSTDISESTCDNCKTKILFCWKTHLPITQSTYLQCSACDANFSTASTTVNEKCIICTSGSLSISAIPSTP